MKVQSHGKLTALPLGSIHAKGWLAEQMERSKNGMGGHLDELEPDMIANPYINCQTDDAWGSVKAGWGAEISGNFWYGLIGLAFTLNDPLLQKKAETWVNGVLANQREDGYMGTYTDADDRMDDYNAWGTHCGMKAMLAYYEATGRADVLEAVRRCMLWFCENWSGDKKTRYAGMCIVESMAVTYLHTGDERLLAFLNEYIAYINDNDLYLESQNAMRSPDLVYNSQHSAAYAADLWIYATAYKAGGDKKNLEAIVNGVGKLIPRALGFNGGIPSFSEYLGPVYASVETEYCTYAYFENSLIHIAEATGDTLYIDLVERILFNGAQGARKKDEHAIAYMSSGNQIHATWESGNYISDMQEYAPVYPTSCCSATSCWVLPDFVRSMAMRGEDGLYLTAYGPCEIHAGDLHIEEDTAYPFRDTICFTIHADEEVPEILHFRVPGWCKNASIAVNGETIAENLAGGAYHAVKRIWHDGDTVELRLPMEIVVRQLDDSEMCARHPMAFEYGPLLFAFPIPEYWRSVKGSPRTPLPEGWSWYDVDAVVPYDKRGDQYEQNGLRPYNISWNIAVDEKITAEDITVELCEADGYVWESPRVKLHLPAYKALYSYQPYARKTVELYQGPIDVYGSTYEITLVPYGCSNLRIAYIPRAKLPAKPMPKWGKTE